MRRVVLSRTAPDHGERVGRLEQGRLSYPLEYWNSLGLLAGLGIVLSGHFACASRDHWVVRVAGAAAVPLLTATLYYTFSPGRRLGDRRGVGTYLVLAQAAWPHRRRPGHGSADRRCADGREPRQGDHR